MKILEHKTMTICSHRPPDADGGTQGKAGQGKHILWGIACGLLAQWCLNKGFPYCTVSGCGGCALWGWSEGLQTPDTDTGLRVSPILYVGLFIACHVNIKTKTVFAYCVLNTIQYYNSLKYYKNIVTRRELVRICVLKYNKNRHNTLKEPRLEPFESLCNIAIRLNLCPRHCIKMYNSLT